ncbi:monocarboxylate transporter 12 [Aplysia californica]|uniref:Monocarboxylate transporter 12 n=1 Tax=Aplysia californica TaxID=6500 RepID=A0ABM0K0P8_APLCA|nr:monocarboxylate transporter 12 [Aplysia californica]
MAQEKPVQEKSIADSENSGLEPDTSFGAGETKPHDHTGNGVEPEDKTKLQTGSDGLRTEVRECGYPIDRGWAWLIVLGCFGMNLLIVGGVRSFGVLFVEFQEKYKASAREIGLAQGFNATLMLALGLVGNLLSERFTYRRVVFMGGILACLGMTLSSLAPTPGWLYVTYGLIAGTGNGMSFSPCIVMVGKHFKKYRSVANGISVSGAGVGAFALPNLLRWLLGTYSLSGTLLIHGGILLNVTVFAMLLRPLSYYQQRQRSNDTVSSRQTALTQNGERLTKTDSPDFQPLLDGGGPTNNNGITIEQVNGVDLELDVVEKQTPSTDNNITVELKTHESKLDNHQAGDNASSHDKAPMILEAETNLNNRSNQNSSLLRFPSNIDIMVSSLQSLPDAVARTGDDSGSRPADGSPPGGPRHGLLSCCCCCNRSGGKSSGPTIFDWTLLTNPVFLIYAISASMSTFAYSSSFMMLPDFAVGHGQDRDSAALILSMMGLSDIVGRILSGWLSDRPWWPRRYGYVACLALSGLVNVMVRFMTSFGSLMAYAILYGLFSANFWALIAVMLTDALGIERLSSSFGLTTLAMSPGFLSSPPLCGALRDATGSWDTSFLLCGIIVLLASTFPLFHPWAQRFVDKREKRKGNSDVVV